MLKTVVLHNLFLETVMHFMHLFLDEYKIHEQLFIIIIIKPCVVAYNQLNLFVLN